MGDVANVVSISAHEINSEYRKAKTSIVDSANHILNVGRMLIDKKAELGHGNFIPWVEAECEFSQYTANRCMRSWSNCGLTNNLTEADAVEISRDTWGNTNSGSVVEHNHLAQGTGEHEWYTPHKYIDAAREVMGEIDLDPASSTAAQKIIKAKKFYTAKDNGLRHPWSGRIWLNPPYSRELIGEFMNKLAEEAGSGRLKEAICLTHNYTDTAWFHNAESIASAICFTRGRIAFISPTGETCAPTQGQAFFYVGNSPNDFARVFTEFGFVR